MIAPAVFGIDMTVASFPDLAPTNALEPANLVLYHYTGPEKEPTGGVQSNSTIIILHKNWKDVQWTHREERAFIPSLH